jgi:hypothetical protein
MSSFFDPIEIYEGWSSDDPETRYWMFAVTFDKRLMTGKGGLVLMWEQHPIMESVPIKYNGRILPPEEHTAFIAQIKKEHKNLPKEEE